MTIALTANTLLGNPNGTSQVPQQIGIDSTLKFTDGTLGLNNPGVNNINVITITTPGTGFYTPTPNVAYATVVLLGASGGGGGGAYEYVPIAIPITSQGSTCVNGAIILNNTQIGTGISYLNGSGGTGGLGTSNGQNAEQSTFGTFVSLGYGGTLNLNSPYNTYNPSSVNTYATIDYSPISNAGTFGDGTSIPGSNGSNGTIIITEYLS